jgi:hydroxymethylpyrimidine/phosphomethylpyrimidine kinase
MALAGEPHVLVVAGSDSSGGAGIVRDIETIAAFGLRSCVAVTAVTVQTHDMVRDVAMLPASLITKQIYAALEANPVMSIKTGMLGTAEAVLAVTGVLRQAPGIPVIVDPVLVSSSGRALLDADAVTLLLEALLPLATLVTPNIPELAYLTDRDPARGREEVLRQARLLLERGANAVLVKGGHAEGDMATDLLLGKDLSVQSFAARRLPGTIRGTGCMLASAIAARLAQGGKLEEAVSDAKDYVFRQMTKRLLTTPDVY